MSYSYHQLARNDNNFCNFDWHIYIRPLLLLKFMFKVVCTSTGILRINRRLYRLLIGYNLDENISDVFDCKWSKICEFFVEFHSVYCLQK